MTSSQKLWLGFGTLTALLVLVCVVIIVRVRSIEGQVGEMANARNLSAAARQLEINTLGYPLNVRAYLQTGEPQARQAAVDDAANAERQLKEYARLATTDRQRDMAARFAPLWREFQKLGQALLDAENRQVKPEDLTKLYVLRTGLEKFLGDEMQVDATATYNALSDAVQQHAQTIVSFALILLIGGGVLVFRGITERKRNEKALLQAEDRLRLAVEVAGLGVNQIDYRTNTVVPDATAAALFGLEAGVPIPRSAVHDRFHPDDSAEILQMMNQSLDPTGDGCFLMDHRVTRPDGSTKWLSVKKQIVFGDVDGVRRPVTGVLAAVDITERKLRERNLALMADMQNVFAPLTTSTEIIRAGKDARWPHRLEARVPSLLQYSN